MSIRNQRTGRHEDDFFARLHGDDGVVTLEEILEHCEEIVAEGGFGSIVRVPVMALVRITRMLASDMELDPHEARFDIEDQQFVHD
jgi:hypothetical protein